MTVEPMDPKKFWQLITQARREAHGEELWDIVEDQAELLTQTLAREASPADILSFHLRFEECMSRAYDARLWDAAALINAGASDDGFAYFRGWLISMGPEIFEQALLDPDSLAQHLDDEIEGEAMLYCAPKAYELVTGRPIDQDLPTDPAPSVLRGEFLDEQDPEALRAAFPALWEKLIGEDDEQDDEQDDDWDEDDEDPDAEERWE